MKNFKEKLRKILQQLYGAGAEEEINSLMNNKIDSQLLELKRKYLLVPKERQYGATKKYYQTPRGKEHNKHRQHRRVGKFHKNCSLCLSELKKKKVTIKKEE